MISATADSGASVEHERTPSCIASPTIVASSPVPPDVAALAFIATPFLVSPPRVAAVHTGGHPRSAGSKQWRTTHATDASARGECAHGRRRRCDPPRREAHPYPLASARRRG